MSNPPLALLVYSANGSHCSFKSLFHSELLSTNILICLPFPVNKEVLSENRSYWSSI